MASWHQPNKAVLAMDYTTKFIHLVSHYRRVATASLRVLFYLALTTHVLGLNHGCLFKSEIAKKNTQGHKDKNAPPETILPHCSWCFTPNDDCNVSN